MWFQLLLCAQLLKFFICSIAHFVIYKNVSIAKIKSHPSVVDYFKELPFYNKPIEKPKIKRLKNIDELAELPFHEQQSTIKINQAFRGYAKSYKVEIIEKKDSIVRLEVSKSSIKRFI